VEVIMEANGEHQSGLWKRIKSRFKWVLEELKEDSVARNPEKPIDCCNPPVYRKPKKN
jgi:hypothetical protein